MDVAEARRAIEAELKAIGIDAAWPELDSLVLVEILVRVEQRLGVRLPEDKATARSLRSVAAFAARFVEIANQQAVAS